MSGQGKNGFLRRDLAVCYVLHQFYFPYFFYCLSYASAPVLCLWSFWSVYLNVVSHIQTPFVQALQTECYFPHREYADRSSQ